MAEVKNHLQRCQTLPFSVPGKSVAKLDEAQRTRLRAIMRERLAARDGSIRYSATAIAAKAQTAMTPK